MTSSARTSISALPRGHELHSATFSLSAKQIDAYLRAVGDRGGYGHTVPPLALLAFALLALQDQLSLPEGSLHTGQELECEGIAREGESLTLNARIAQRSERQGFVISVIELDVASAEGVVLRARTTIIAPAEAS